MSKERKQSTEAAVREIRRRTRRKFSPEEKVRIEPTTEQKPFKAHARHRASLPVP